MEELAGSDELRMDYDLEPGAPSQTQPMLPENDEDAADHQARAIQGLEQDDGRCRRRAAHAEHGVRCRGRCGSAWHSAPTDRRRDLRRSPQSPAGHAGDIQLLHNHVILHSRTAFTDWEEPERRRHLLRLWLCPPIGRPLAPEWAQQYRSTEVGRRGGIWVPGVEPNVDLEREQ